MKRNESPLNASDGMNKFLFPLISNKLSRVNDENAYLGNLVIWLFCRYNHMRFPATGASHAGSNVRKLLSSMSNAAILVPRNYKKIFKYELLEFNLVTYLGRVLGTISQYDY